MLVLACPGCGSYEIRVEDSTMVFRCTNCSIEGVPLSFTAAQACIIPIGGIKLPPAHVIFSQEPLKKNVK